MVDEGIKSHPILPTSWLERVLDDRQRGPSWQRRLRLCERRHVRSIYDIHDDRNDRVLVEHTNT